MAPDLAYQKIKCLESLGDKETLERYKVIPLKTAHKARQIEMLYLKEWFDA